MGKEKRIQYMKEVFVYEKENDLRKQPYLKPAITGEMRGPPRKRVSQRIRNLMQKYEMIPLARQEYHRTSIVKFYNPPPKTVVIPLKVIPSTCQPSGIIRRWKILEYEERD